MTIRKVERRGETRLIIDIHYRKKDGSQGRYRHDAQVNTVAAATALLLAASAAAAPAAAPLAGDMVPTGQRITRSVGFAIVRVGEFFTVDEVVFGEEGDLALLGARTLEGFNATVDPSRKRLVAAGPVPAAGAWLGEVR